MQRVELLGARIHDLAFGEALERISALVAADRRALVVTPNVDHLVRLERDVAFRAAYAAADLVLADGVPLLWACRLLGRPLRAKVSGSDLLPAYAELAAARGHRLYFLGGRPGAAVRAAQVLAARHAGLQVVGIDVPPVGFERDPRLDGAVMARVRAARPDVLFVGLGSPKQELWLAERRLELEVPVSIGVGGAFEMVAGLVPRAPRWMQRVGLEWAWRLAREPRRLWRRYLLEDPRFFALVFAQWRAARRCDPSAA
ncbi:MAG: WecB/TagA/CpsF family glycosyltransferase [Planctomycetota bacterium]